MCVGEMKRVSFSCENEVGIEEVEGIVFVNLYIKTAYLHQIKGINISKSRSMQNSPCGLRDSLIIHLRSPQTRTESEGIERDIRRLWYISADPPRSVHQH